METINSSNPEIQNLVGPSGVAGEVEHIANCVNEISTKLEMLEKSVNEVEQFYSATGNTHPTKGYSVLKDKDKEKHFISVKQLQLQDASQRDGAAAKRMQELMRQFATILRQLTQHKWAWPFMEPVDVEGLGLHDYFQVIEKPMDFGTIKNKMESKDSDLYNNVREIYADVRLVFKNAMKYNDEKDDVHVMAKTLLEKFEEKWLQLLPKVAEEEKRREDEEAKAQLDIQLNQEATYASMATHTRNELYELEMHLRKMKETVIQKCSLYIVEGEITNNDLFRRMTTDEKRKLGAALTHLSPEDLSKALEIVAENNPSFHATAQEVDLDIDAQSEYTLWKLKVFVKEALKVQGNNISTNVATNNNNDDNKKNNSKRRREICDALAKTAVKRTKKMSNC